MLGFPSDFSWTSFRFALEKLPTGLDSLPPPFAAHTKGDLAMGREKSTRGRRRWTKEARVAGHCFGGAAVAEQARTAGGAECRRPIRGTDGQNPASDHVRRIGDAHVARESRESLPKQFIPLVGELSTFQSIVGLVGDAEVFEPAVVITNFDYRFRVAEQLTEIGAEAGSCSSRSGATAPPPSAPLQHGPRPATRRRSSPCSPPTMSSRTAYDNSRNFARGGQTRRRRAKSSPLGSRPTIRRPATATFIPRRRSRSSPKCGGSRIRGEARRKARARVY